MSAYIGLSLSPTTQIYLIMDIVPYISISPSKVCLYNRLENYTSNKSDRQLFNEENLQINKQQGEISKKARRKIESAIDWLLYTSSDKKAYSKKAGKYYNFKIMFVTLTLSSTQMHSDFEIKEKLLNQFLVETRKKWSCKKYLWRAESQKNGNIHFHIVFNKFIPWQWIKTVWNRIQNKYSYVDRFANSQYKKFDSGFFFDKYDRYKRTYKQQLKSYKEGISGNWYKPNSTDVHSIKKVKNISRYLSKYCTKNDSNLRKPQICDSSKRYYAKPGTNETRQIEGNLWYLSTELSRLKSAIEVVDSEISADLSTLHEHFQNKLKHYDYCSIYYVNSEDLKKISSFTLQTILNEYTAGFIDN